MLRLNEILKVVRGKFVQGDLSSEVSGVSIDSRTTKKGDLFIAIKGEKFDGHHFIKDVLKKGAKAFIVSTSVKIDRKIPVIKVEDTTRALGQVASLYRSKFNVPVVAVTGSAGKTTTKEMIAAVLGSRYRVLKNTKTENNHFGVPLTLLKLNASHEIVVLEMGTNQKGDIRWLSEIAKPNVAIFTNVGESHLLGLKSPGGVFKEKFQLVKFLSRDGCVIFNKDDRFLGSIDQKNFKFEKVSYSVKKSSHYQASKIQIHDGSKLSFNLKNREYVISTPAKHNIYNALATISCAEYFDVPYKLIKKSLGDFKFGLGRQEVKEVGGIKLIDDSYNSNPVSFRAAIVTMDSIRVRGQKILVCGDMLELGRNERKLHENMGKLISESSIDVLLTIGKLASEISKVVAKINSRTKVYHCLNYEQIHEKLKTVSGPHDLILVKGSRGMRMEQVVEKFSSYIGKG